jgi:hypothetical protein
MKISNLFKLPQARLCALAVGLKHSRMTAILLFVMGAGAPLGNAQVSLSQALDTTNLVWTTGGSASWSGQTTVAHDGVDAARSGFISDAQESWLQMTVTGPGTVVFWWKVSSEGDYDMLEFLIGGIRQS